MKEKVLNLLFIIVIALGFVICNYQLQSEEDPITQGWTNLFWRLGAFILVTFLVVGYFQTRQIIIAGLILIYFIFVNLIWNIPHNYLLEIIGISSIVITHYINRKRKDKTHKISTGFIVFSILALIIWIIIVSQL